MKMCNSIVKHIVGTVAIAIMGYVAVVSGATATADIEAAVGPYSHSRVVNESRASVDDHRVALGAMKKVRGVWAPEMEQRADGELWRSTQEIAEGHSAVEVFQFYNKRMQSLDARALYVCHDRECGASNSWANDLFKIKELYGLDGDQHYAAYEMLDEDQHLNFVTFYTVTRGNQRVFAQVELLKTALVTSERVAPNPDVIVQQLADRGFYIVSGIDVQDETLHIRDEHIAAMVAALTKNRRATMRIVGHDYSAGTLEQQQARALNYAQTLREQLIAAGVSADRLQAYGVGSLAPAKFEDNETIRLELVTVR